MKSGLEGYPNLVKKTIGSTAVLKDQNMKNKH